MWIKWLQKDCCKQNFPQESRIPRKILRREKLHYIYIIILIVSAFCISVRYMYYLCDVFIYQMRQKFEWFTVTLTRLWESMTRWSSSVQGRLIHMKSHGSKWRSRRTSGRFFKLFCNQDCCIPSKYIFLLVNSQSVKHQNLISVQQNFNGVKESPLEQKILMLFNYACACIFEHIN